MINAADLFPKWLSPRHDLYFVERLELDSTGAWEKAVVGFLNGAGGDLLVGVMDSEGTLRGMGRKELERQGEIFRRWVSRRLVPSLTEGVITYSYPTYQEDGAELFLMVATIRPGPFPPYALKEEDGGEAVYIRQEGVTRRVSRWDLVALIGGSPAESWDLGMSDVPFQKEGFRTLYGCYLEQNGVPLNEGVLGRVSFFEEDGFLRRGSLLFQDGCDIPSTLVSCRRWKGAPNGPFILLNRKERKGDVLSQIAFLLDFVEEFSSIGLEKLDDGNREIRSYPARAILEAASVAFVQRDYRIEDASIELDIYDDRLVLGIPGVLPAGKGVFSGEDLRALPIRRTNPLVADVLSLCRLMEKSGSGFLRIAECYKDAPKGKKPWWSASGASFSLTLPDLLYEGPGLPSLHRSLSFLPLPGKRKHDRAILSYCYESPKRAVDIAEALGLSRSAYFYNAVLAPLVKASYLVEAGDGYLTNRDLVKEE